MEIGISLLAIKRLLDTTIWSLLIGYRKYNIIKHKLLYLVRIDENTCEWWDKMHDKGRKIQVGEMKRK